MKTKKILSGVLAGVFALASLAACGDNTGGSAMINIMNTGGGVGRAWLDNAIARYQKENPGVVFNVEHNIDTAVGTMSNSGYSIYFVEEGGIAELSASGKLLNITDLLTQKNEKRNGEDISILDKVREDSRAMLQGYDGEYYALPHFTLYSGLSYDAELFTEKGFYLADYDLEVGEDVIQHTSAYGTANFVKPNKPDVKKSVGNDGVAGTYDDGLPSTLKEFCILCDRMNRNETTPIELNGTVRHYISNLIKGMWASLAGYEEMRVAFTYDGDVDSVVGYGEEGMMQGVSRIKKPQVEKKKVTEATGYLAHTTEAKYYATAFIDLIRDTSWLSADNVSNTVTPGTAQLKFICNGYNDGGSTYGMLVEATHWYNEAKNNKSFKSYELLSEKKNTDMTRDIRFMPLPTALEAPVTGKDNARKYTMVQASSSYAFVNANIAKNETLKKEVKKFLAFLYSDAELSHFVGTTGVTRGFLNHEVLPEDAAKLSVFQKSVVDMTDTSDVVYFAADNDTFLRNSSTLSLGTLTRLIQPTVDGVSHFTYLDALDYGRTTRQIFEATQWSKSQWEAMYVAD